MNAKRGNAVDGMFCRIMSVNSVWVRTTNTYRGADKSLTRPGRKQARKHVRDACDINNIETRAVINFFFFLQVKTPKEIHIILTETLACFLHGRAKDLSAPLYYLVWCFRIIIIFFPPTSQGAEGNSHHSDTNISLFPSWSG